ncbi:unnamed protein product [Anisakis simplex]|uniref:RNA-binding protein 4 (inferred by orthology to a D. melanogaster protein) n=1 Tax=Anisakis simplex TaxID=6269 RepID=A0A0M3JUF7_ANISI|nr:unnamed protein product [Anisakis simplex]
MSAHSERILITGLAPETTYGMVERYFSEFGALTECTVMTDKDSRRCRGFAFISFMEKSVADECMQVSSHYINAMKVNLRLIDDVSHDDEFADVPVKKILVSFTDRDISARQIHEYFSRFGDVKVDFDEDDEDNLGIAYVTFDDDITCKTCLAINEHRINGYDIDIRALIRKEDLLKNEQSKREKMASDNQSDGNNSADDEYNHHHNHLKRSHSSTDYNPQQMTSYTNVNSVQPAPLYNNDYCNDITGNTHVRPFANYCDDYGNNYNYSNMNVHSEAVIRQASRMYPSYQSDYYSHDYKTNSCPTPFHPSNPYYSPSAFNDDEQPPRKLFSPQNPSAASLSAGYGGYVRGCSNYFTYPNRLNYPT